MDGDNYKNVKDLAGNYWDENKIDLLLNELYPNQNKEVPDPWYGGFEDFKQVYAMIDKACNKIISNYGGVIFANH